MEGQEGPTSAITAPAPSSPPSPPHDLGPDSTPVGSPDHDHALPEIHAVPSDDEHDHEDHEHGVVLDQSAGAGVLTEDLKNKIIKQARTCLSTLSYYKLVEFWTLGKLCALFGCWESVENDK